MSLLRAAQVTLALAAGAWLLACADVLVEAGSIGAALPPGMVAAVTGLGIFNTVLMLGAIYAAGQGRQAFTTLALAVVFINMFLVFSEEFSRFDLLTLGIDLLAIGALLWLRARQD